MSTYYFSSNAVTEIQIQFYEFMIKTGISPFNDTGGKKIRDKMFDFFRSPDFLDSYFRLAIDVADSLNMKNCDLVLQSQPTPRIFRPGDHGTSFHCDYWYGHGESAYTIWTPLTEIEEGNTFHLLEKEKNDHYLEILSAANGRIEIESELITNSLIALPAKGQSVVFNSKIIHGSPKNTSSKERISFDFRICCKSDLTSTKDLTSYFYFDGDGFKRPKVKFGQDRYIKYISGGREKDTAAQHMIIESVAKLLLINIVAQEAEVERFGNVVLDQYLDGLAKAKNLQGIVVASKSLLSPQIIDKANKSDIKVFCVLENLFL